jgi:hypothetical protein
MWASYYSSVACLVLKSGFSFIAVNMWGINHMQFHILTQNFPANRVLLIASSVTCLGLLLESKVLWEAVP